MVKGAADFCLHCQSFHSPDIYTLPSLLPMYDPTETSQKPYKVFYLVLFCRWGN